MSIVDSPYHIFTLERKDFLNAAIETFQYQAVHCEIYKKYICQIGVTISEVAALADIPFLPIQFFKTHKVVSAQKENYLLFESSATTSQTPSKHYVADKKLYDYSILKSFEIALGPLQGKIILGLLPHYLDRKNSSLIYMVDYLMKNSGQNMDGFFLDKEEELFKLLQQLEAQGQEVVLFGVTFALLDFAKKYSLTMKHTRIIETGGMKGRREEMTREAIHHQLQAAFGLRAIFSEYGMAELLSQSYYLENKKFVPPTWKRALVRDAFDPFDVTEQGKGALNIIDLANRDSCSFIATDDLGVVDHKGNFEVLGRLDASEIRGCNLLLSE